MRRIVVREVGGPEQLTLEESTVQLQPGREEILVDVEAAGVNYIDVYQRQGRFGATLPFTPGLEGTGRVREIGTGIDGNGRLKVGDRVAWINTKGSYSSEVAIPSSQAIQIPRSFSLSEGLLFQPITAQYLVNEYRRVMPGDRVLVHAAAGGVGHLLVQWLKHLGAWVVGTTSSDTKAAAARAAGADAVINYGQDYNFLEELLALTNGKGVDLAFDAIGQATLTSTVRALAIGGTAVSCGSSSGPVPAIDPMLLISKATRLGGGSLFVYIDDAGSLQRRAAAVIEGIREGWLRVSDATQYRLEAAADAHLALQSRNTHGKLYLVP